MTRTYRYEGEAPMNGVTLRDGTQTLLHKGKEYEFDDKEPFVLNLLGKRNAQGMPRPWLVEVPKATQAKAPEPHETESEKTETTDTQQKRK